MARLSRLVFPGVALHIIQRGNNRNACFREDGDYLTYLAHLRQLTTKHECALHAYCLMTNHVHLLLTPTEPEACALLMRDLGRTYAVVESFREYRRAARPDADTALRISRFVRRFAANELSTAIRRSPR